MPDKFAEALAKTHIPDCVFADSIGIRFGDVHYAFADLIAVEMMVGTMLDDATVVKEMFDRTFDLVVKFIKHSESFIADQLEGWGFEVHENAGGKK